MNQFSKKVLLVANTDWYLYHFRLSLARALRERGWSPVLASPPGPYAAGIEAEGYPWRPVSMSRRGMRVSEELRSILMLRALYRSERPDLVHHFTMKPVLYGSLAAKLVSGVEVVNSVTGLGYLFMENRPLIKALRTLLMPAFRWALSGNRVHQVFEHEGDREYFLTKRLTRSDQSSIIRGVGVDLVRFTPRAEPYPPPTVIMASRLLWDKGVGEFVEAARRLRVAQPSIRFVLVGEPDPGNPTTVPEEVIKDWIEQGVVEWWGHRADMPEVLAQSHLVALPSHGEGIPTILLEAAASGRPIVATDIPGNREVVVHGETGILVPVGDVEALADALMKLIDDPAMRTRMGAKARERAELLFGQDQINQTTLELYHELLDAH